MLSVGVVSVNTSHVLLFRNLNANLIEVFTNSDFPVSESKWSNFELGSYDELRIAILQVICIRVFQNNR